MAVTITRADVADLQPGDVVELSGGQYLNGATITGPLRAHHDDNGALLLADGWCIRNWQGDPHDVRDATLTVVSRAPRLYVNHPRTEPVPGDVVDYSDGHLDGIGPWFAHRAREGSDLFWMSPTGPVLGEMPYPMRLLVDGESGLPPAVQS